MSGMPPAPITGTSGRPTAAQITAATKARLLVGRKASNAGKVSDSPMAMTRNVQVDGASSDISAVHASSQEPAQVSPALAPNLAGTSRLSFCELRRRHPGSRMNGTDSVDGGYEGRHEPEQ